MGKIKKNETVGRSPNRMRSRTRQGELIGELKGRVWESRRKGIGEGRRRSMSKGTEHENSYCVQESWE